jgi:hypothetical protein
MAKLMMELLKGETIVRDLQWNNEFQALAQVMSSACPGV